MDMALPLDPLGFAPSRGLMKSMGFWSLEDQGYVWNGPPMLIYLGYGRLMNKVDNSVIMLKATNDREFVVELVAHGWIPRSR